MKARELRIFASFRLLHLASASTKTHSRAAFYIHSLGETPLLHQCDSRVEVKIGGTRVRSRFERLVPVLRSDRAAQRVGYRLAEALHVGIVLRLYHYAR
jgi:hypothetical protein